MQTTGHACRSREAGSALKLSMLVQITVLESLVYSARLRFSKSVSTDIVYSFVQEVRPAQLCEGLQHTCVDMPFLGLSEYHILAAMAVVKAKWIWKPAI